MKQVSMLKQQLETQEENGQVTSEVKIKQSRLINEYSHHLQS
jgi:hypothetical protein